MTNLTNMKNVDLADTYGALKAKIAGLAKEEKALKAVISERLSRSNSKALNGHLFRVTKSEGVSETLDTAAAKALLELHGEEIPTKTSEFTRYNVKSLVKEAA